MVAETAGVSLIYQEPGELRTFTGLAALAKVLNHINFAYALVSAWLLFLALPVQALRQDRMREISVEGHE
ncbi:MAG: hypothetical protein CFE44_17650 [Burkholderiales bacterium PBB4]|nr:MAG: hypothetical protein CFE44_17650 [Burkholderiales bacterium PBB4]